MDDKTVKADLMVVQLDRARTALAEAKTIGETKKIADMAHAAQIYARRQQLGEEAMAYALAIKFEAMRKLGEMLEVKPNAKPGRKTDMCSTVEHISESLKELGIDRKVAMVAQQMAPTSTAATDCRTSRTCAENIHTGDQVRGAAQAGRDAAGKRAQAERKRDG